MTHSKITGGRTNNVVIILQEGYCSINAVHATEEFRSTSRDGRVTKNNLHLLS